MISDYSRFFLKISDYLVEVSVDTFFKCFEQIKLYAKDFEYYYDPVYMGCKCTEFTDSSGNNHFFGQEMTEEYYKDIYLKECRSGVCNGIYTDNFLQEHIVDRALI